MKRSQKKKKKNEVCSDIRENLQISSYSKEALVRQEAC